ncbi:MAG: LysR family transcriptional regulator [Gammaproteobacteria bacterium]|nr:LysR family transcriptional regulator [Gammaproteobacteria bacterium]
MDSRFLQSFIAVIEQGSIAQAARSENLTAAAISQRIQALERQLAVPLLTRIGHTVTPTAAGTALLPRAKHIVSEVALLAGDVDPSGLTGTLRIGVISTALTGLMPAALPYLTRNFPGIQLHIVPGTSRDLYQQLQDCQLDAAILVAPSFAIAKGMRTTLLRQEPLCLVTYGAPVASIADQLQQQPYIRYDPQSWGGRHAQAFLQQQAIQPKVLCDLDALEAINLLVAQQLGCSLVPHWFAAEQLPASCYVTPVEDLQFARHIVLLTNAHVGKANMLKALQAAMQQQSTSVVDRSYPAAQK